VVVGSGVGVLGMGVTVTLAGGVAGVQAPIASSSRQMTRKILERIAHSFEHLPNRGNQGDCKPQKPLRTGEI